MFERAKYRSRSTTNKPVEPLRRLYSVVELEVRVQIDLATAPRVSVAAGFCRCHSEAIKLRPFLRDFSFLFLFHIQTQKEPCITFQIRASDHYDHKLNREP